MPPNVLLIVFDTARADAFGPYGAGDGASPVLDQLARAGGAFPTAFSASNWTMPSHVAMFSGTLPRSIGLARAPDGKRSNCRRVLESRREHILTEVLRHSGYRTAAVSSNPWIGRHAGFATGFDEFHEVRGGRRRQIHDKTLRARLTWLMEGLLARVDDGAAEAEALLTRWIGEAGGRPFFWFVNLIECHSPYMPPRPYNDLGFRHRTLVAEEARQHLTLAGIWRACVSGVDIPPDVLGRMRHLYGRSIRLMDDWLGRILERMDARGLLDDTLVVVTSDHGENLGEGRLIGHAFSLDDRLIRVPLVLAGPGAKATDAVTSTAAIPRIIADAIGLEGHPWGNGSLPSNAAVAQYDALMSRDDPRLETARRDWRPDEEGIRRLTEPCTCATDGRWKVVRIGGTDRLYDLRSDPHELTPMDPGGSSDPVIGRLRDLVVRHHAPGAPPPGTPASADDTESAELEERLKLLGYL